MKQSAQFVAEELNKVGVDAHVVQSHNPDGTPGAWEVIGSKIVDIDAPTVLLYAHHDAAGARCQRMEHRPIRRHGNRHTPVRTRRGRDGNGIAIHSGALQALGDDLKVNIKVFIEGEEEMGSLLHSLHRGA